MNQRSGEGQSPLELYEAVGIEVVPLADALGAEIRGVDLGKPIADTTFAAIRRAWLDHCVIRFRDQDLSDRNLVDFSALFGKLDLAPNQGGETKHIPGLPEVFVVSNVLHDGEPIGSLGDGECDWHTDMSYVDVPPKASVLYALEVPADGSGDTGFLSMYLACERLPKDLERRIEGVALKHDAARALQGYVRAGFDGAAIDDITQALGPVHPIVRIHPETGRRALYLGRQWNGETRATQVVGMSLADSNALLDELWEYVRANQDNFTWFQHWRVGDLVVWDNRCVMHYRPPFTPTARRIMHRTQIKAEERPV